MAALGLGSVRGGGTIYEGVVVSTCGPKARSGGTRDQVGLGFEFGSGTGKGTALMGKAHLAVRMREGRGGDGLGRKKGNRPAVLGCTGRIWAGRKQKERRERERKRMGWAKRK